MQIISVCMASYNGEQYIRQQLLSILVQLSQHDEVIISDDGSTDSTLKIIDQLGDARIKVFLNRGRHGPMGNFEHALRHANGNFIFLADQDDAWLPGKVNIIRNLLNKYDLILTDCWVVNGNDVIVHESFFNHRGSKPGFWNNLYKNSYMGCCMAFRREVLSYVLPFPDKVHMHDWWMGLLVEIKGTVCFYPQPLIKYVRHGDNASPTGESGYGLTKRLINRFFLLINIVKRLV